MVRISKTIVAGVSALAMAAAVVLPRLQRWPAAWQAAAVGTAADGMAGVGMAADGMAAVGPVAGFGTEAIGAAVIGTTAGGALRSLRA